MTDWFPLSIILFTQLVGTNNETLIFNHQRILHSLNLKIQLPLTEWISYMLSIFLLVHSKYKQPFFAAFQWSFLGLLLYRTNFQHQNWYLAEYKSEHSSNSQPPMHREFFHFFTLQVILTTLHFSTVLVPFLNWRYSYEALFYFYLSKILLIYPFCDKLNSSCDISQNIYIPIT